jgi:hypothetical protein
VKLVSVVVDVNSGVASLPFVPSGSSGLSVQATKANIAAKTAIIEKSFFIFVLFLNYKLSKMCFAMDM